MSSTESGGAGGGAAVPPACPDAAIVAATLRMATHWRGLTPLVPRSHDWGSTEPSLHTLSGGHPTSTECACHPRLWHAPATAELFVICSLARVSTAMLKGAVEVLERLGLRRIHLVTRHGVPAQALNMLPSAARLGELLAVVSWTLVLSQPLDHVLVPRHSPVTPAETGVLRTNSSAAAVLPLLRADDPIVQYLGLRAGDVVRVDRHDNTPYFRLVVSVAIASSTPTPPPHPPPADA